MTKKPKLLMLKGLPASGKTTYARELVDKGWIRVNKDDLRALLNNGKWSKENESRILRLRDTIIGDALDGNSNVVVDDTNFEEKHYTALSDLAEKHGAEFEVLFIDTPLEDCIARNERRAQKVPLNVIYGMHNKYIAPLRNEKQIRDDELDECIVVDIDGTLAHINPDNPRDVYDASRAMDDLLDDAVAAVVGMAFGHGYPIIILTGRSDNHLQITMDWLESQGVEYDEIYSRAAGDKRPDEVVKKELYEKNIKGRYNVKFIIDDRPKVCRMWREIGMKVFQVGDPHIEF